MKTANSTEPAISSGLRPIRSDSAPSGGINAIATRLATVMDTNASVLLNSSVFVK